jgi:hypothetical protein
MFIHGSRFHPTIRHMGLVLLHYARQSYVVSAEMTLLFRLGHTLAQIITLRTEFEAQLEYATIAATSGK